MQYGLCKINKSVPPLTLFFHAHCNLLMYYYMRCRGTNLTLFRLRSSLEANYAMMFRNRRRETTRWRIVESPQHSIWHLARMLLECSWELLQNVMAWFLNYVCRVVATRDARREMMWRGHGREKGCERLLTEGEGEGEGEGRGLLRHWESMSLKGQRLTHLLIYSWRYTRELLPFPLSFTLFLAGPMSILNYYISA